MTSKQVSTNLKNSYKASLDIFQKAVFEKYRLVQVQYPLYSPEIAACNFFFYKLKIHLESKI